MYNNTVVSATNKMLRTAFSYMTLGLLITFLIPAFIILTKNYALVGMIYKMYFPILILEFIVVMFLGARIYKLSLGAARISFILYSALNGLVFTIIGMAVGDLMIIGYTLLITIIMFATTAIYGYMTSEDLSSYNRYLMTGLIALIIMSVINIFISAPMLYWVVSVFGVVIFSALTAIDVNRIKNMSYQMTNGNEAMLEKMGIMGALQLYLDFINLFLYLLRIFSGKKNN